MWRRLIERVTILLIGFILRHLWPFGSHCGCEISTVQQSLNKRNVLSHTSLLRGSATKEQGVARFGAPSVVITMLDDAGSGDAGALGHPVLLTPHIDRFASSAVAFSQAYGGAPTCSPSRAALLTGRSPYRTGVYDFLSKKTGGMHLAWSERTIANLLRGAGYATAHFGKWHLSRNGNGHSPYHFGFEHSNGSFLAASSLIDICVSWLSQGRKHKRQPFFLYLALWEPREPVDHWSPRHLRQLYEGTFAGPVPSAVSRHGRSLESVAPAVAIGGGECAWRLPHRNPPSVYYGAISQIDEALGELLGQLDSQDLRQNTIFILASDNGPEHREANSWGSSGGLRGAKGFVYEGGIRIPLLIQWPAVLSKPTVVDEPVHLWDLLPTICAVVGIRPPSDRKIDGVSLLPVFDFHWHPMFEFHRQQARGGGQTLAGEQGIEDPAVDAEASELRGEHVRTRPHVEGLGLPRLRLPPAQPSLLPHSVGLHQRMSTRACTINESKLDGSSLSWTRTWSTRLQRETPLFWGMHRAKGGVQYALRRGPWKLLGGYGPSAARAYGPDNGDDVVPWLRSKAIIGHVELYLLSHDAAERVDLAGSHPHIVTALLVQMQRLLRETAREGPEVKGWTQRSVSCPRVRVLRSLNMTEVCCRWMASTDQI